MAVRPIASKVRIEDSLAQSLLLDSNQNRNQNQSHHRPPKPEHNDDIRLERFLQRLDTFLAFLGFRQSSGLSCVLSWTGFVLVGVALPVVVIVLTNCSTCEEYQVQSFELDIVASQACLAAVSLLCISHNLRKYGIRKFLFVDRYTGHLSQFRDEYIKQISGSVRLLVYWVLPCFLLKTAREVARVLYSGNESWWLSTAIILALVLSWNYVSITCLSASMLFHLVCNLQVMHFADYVKLMESESDIIVLMEEHVRLRHNLSKISHRFRIYLLLEFLVVLASQFVTLLQTTRSTGTITLISGGDFAVSTVIQVVGITLCLHSATKISHRAQGIVAFASRWHALVTGSSNDSSQSSRAGTGHSDSTNNLSSLEITYSESDLESLDYVTMPTNTHLVSLISSYHKRQAFVTYLQANPGGITIFGWTIDRALLNTIFFIELTLVTFVLGKTLVFTS